TIRGMDGFQARALQMIASGEVRAAFEVEREPDKVRARYGEGPVKHGSHPGPMLLQARRLIEAGVSVVTACFFGAGPWDTHRHNFITLRELLPTLDQALSALIMDLEERGLLQDVAVLMGGEFGRTPRIGDQTPDGRSHWPEAGFLWVAGGGLKTGQAIGATDPRGERVVGSPIRLQNVLATLYRVLDIELATTFRDHNGRPVGRCSGSKSTLLPASGLRSISMSAQPFFVVLGPMSIACSVWPSALTTSCQSPRGSWETEIASRGLAVLGTCTCERSTQ